MSWLRRRSRRDEELNEEMEAHLLLAEREALALGHSRVDARSAARREFGGVEIAKEVTRDAWGCRWLIDLMQDVRYALRGFREPSRLVSVNGRSDTWNAKIFGEQKLAYQDFLDCQRDARSVEMAALVYNNGTLSDQGLPEYDDYNEITP